jgi:hypothetical protein
MSVAELARRRDVTRQQIYQWRSELRSKGLLPSTPSKFVSVELAPEPDLHRPAADGVGARYRDRIAEWPQFASSDGGDLRQNQALLAAPRAGHVHGRLQLARSNERRNFPSIAITA